jgi:hypothetical protein
MICFTLRYIASFQFTSDYLSPCDDLSRLACVLNCFFVERVSPGHLRSLLALSSRIPVLRVIQGVTPFPLPLGSLASPDERPPLHQNRQRPTHLHPPKNPNLPLVSLPHPTEKVDQKLRRRHYKFPTNRTSSGHINPCPNPNLLLCLHRRCSKRS